MIFQVFRLGLLGSGSGIELEKFEVAAWSSKLRCSRVWALKEKEARSQDLSSGEKNKRRISLCLHRRECHLGSGGSVAGNMPSLRKALTSEKLSKVRTSAAATTTTTTAKPMTCSKILPGSSGLEKQQNWNKTLMQLLTKLLQCREELRGIRCLSQATESRQNVLDGDGLQTPRPADCSFEQRLLTARQSSQKNPTFAINAATNSVERVTLFSNPQPPK